ncbi:hypothetical protein [Bauldia sp.]|uniref:hypothetical protein n=1 Tax=Bauldia sp. TaxID=2575872 RepID=UPI003BABE984
MIAKKNKISKPFIDKIKKDTRVLSDDFGRITLTPAGAAAAANDWENGVAVAVGRLDGEVKALGVAADTRRDDQGRGGRNLAVT